MNAQALIESVGAIVTDSHFVYTSTDESDGQRRHGTAYVAKERLLHDPAIVHEMLVELAAFVTELGDIKAIVGPELCGSVLGLPLAAILNSTADHDVRFAIARKSDGSFELRGSNAEVVREAGRVAVIEDILNSGRSAAATANAVHDLSATPVAVLAIANRGGVTADSLGVGHLKSLVDFQMEVMTATECMKRGPCSQRVLARTDLGHGRQFNSTKSKELWAPAPGEPPRR